MISEGSRRNCPTDPELILKELELEPQVVEHIKAVSELAMEIGRKADIRVDMDLIYKGSMLHDIGRSRSHGIEHIVEGEKIGREMGLGEEVVGIIRSHIGAGMSREEAVSLGLPAGDYFPVTPEEKIVAYADNLVRGARRIGFEESLERFRAELGDGHPAIGRMKRLHREVSSWVRKK